MVWPTQPPLPCRQRAGVLCFQRQKTNSDRCPDVSPPGDDVSTEPGNGSLHGPGGFPGLFVLRGRGIYRPSACGEFI